MFHKFSNFYIKFRTCILSPILCYIILKPMQNILKIFSSLSLLKLFQAITVDRPVDRNCFRPKRSTGPYGRRRACRARLSVDRVGRPSTPAVDRSVDRLHGTCSLLCRSTGQKYVFKNAMRSTGRSTGANGYLPSGLPADRPVDRQLSRLTPTALFWIYFIFYGFQRLFSISKWLNSPLMT